MKQYIVRYRQFQRGRRSERTEKVMAVDQKHAKIQVYLNYPINQHHIKIISVYPAEGGRKSCNKNAL